MPKDSKNKYPIRKLQEHNGQYWLNIPKSIAQAKGWEKGIQILVKITHTGALEIEEYKSNE